MQGDEGHALIRIEYLDPKLAHYKRNEIEEAVRAIIDRFQTVASTLPGPPGKGSSKTDTNVRSMLH